MEPEEDSGEALKERSSVLVLESDYPANSCGDVALVDNG